jgi:hypothetical protein
MNLIRLAGKGQAHQVRQVSKRKKNGTLTPDGIDQALAVKSGWSGKSASKKNEC